MFVSISGQETNELSLPGGTIIIFSEFLLTHLKCVPSYECFDNGTAAGYLKVVWCV